MNLLQWFGQVIQSDEIIEYAILTFKNGDHNQTILTNFKIPIRSSPVLEFINSIEISVLYTLKVVISLRNLNYTRGLKERSL